MDQEEYNSMECIRRILQHEADTGGLVNHVPTAATNLSSRYEVLKNVFSVNTTLGNLIIDVHNFKHPWAMQKQRDLFESLPGCFPFFMACLLDVNQPIRELNQYKLVLNLLDDKYPTVVATQAYLQDWAKKLEDALNDFLGVCTFCALFVNNNRRMSAAERRQLFRTIAKARLSPFRCRRRGGANSRGSGPAGRVPRRPSSPRREPEEENFMEAWLPMYRFTQEALDAVTLIGDIRVIGEIKEEERDTVVQMALAHKYQLARKLALLRSIEPSPKFTAGLVDMVSLCKDFPNMLIGFTYDGDLEQNIPTLGLDFNKLHPVICMDTNMVEERQERYTTNDFDYFFIKLSTVEVGDFPPGPNDEFFLMKKREWIARAEQNNYSISNVFNPILLHDRAEKPKWKKRKGTDLAKLYFWEDRYLMHIINKYRSKNGVDAQIVEGMLHMVKHPEQCRKVLAEWHLGMPPGGQFKAAPVLYSPFNFGQAPAPAQSPAKSPAQSLSP